MDTFSDGWGGSFAPNDLNSDGLFSDDDVVPETVQGIGMVALRDTAYMSPLITIAVFHVPPIGNMFSEMYQRNRNVPGRVMFQVKYV
jgi:hypothetical protein